MPNRLFYIGGEWLTYEQAHRLGYTLFPPKILTLYTQSNSEVQIRQDITDKKYYDSSNQRWVDDFYTLHLYSYINNITCYKGESNDEYSGYSNHSNDNSIKYILYDSSIRDLQSLYYSKGLTTYKCKNVIVDGSNQPVVWYDSKTNKYFDDRDGIHQWVDRIDDSPVTMYNSSENQSKKIYENETTDSFFIDGTIISRDNFYSYDNYGVIRDIAYTFLEPSAYRTYYDTYSDEYCIPNVTSVWMSRDDILDLGYIFIEGIADMWLCQEPLHLPWKYLPTSGILHFVNTQYSDLTPRIELPEDIEELIGTEIILPEITGVYTDNDSIRWQPTRWDIGEFNSVFVLNEDTTADIECAKVKVTIRFENPYYSGLAPEIHLPEPMTVDNGDFVTLPLIDGEYIDQDNIKWYPLRWSIGEFNSSFVLHDDITANLICEKMKVTLTFTNESHRELHIPLPDPLVRYQGDNALLPRMRGVYKDDQDIGWIPLEWSLGRFDSFVTLTSDLTTDLVWQPLAESMAVALCGSMPTDSGASTEAGVSLILSADGSMRLDPFEFVEKYLTDICESYSGRLEVWDSSYTPPVAPERGTGSYSTSDQMTSGTVRIWGVYDNDYIDVSIIGASMSFSDLKMTPLSFESDCCTVYGDRLQIWPSSYIPEYIDFPVKTIESSNQMICGSIRKWGNYANRGVDLDLNIFAGTMEYYELNLAPLSFGDDCFTLYGDCLKVYDKHYEPDDVPFPDKPLVEPRNQMICGTIRIKGNKANRGIDISVIFDDGVNPNDNWTPATEDPINVEPVNEDPQEDVDYIDILLGIRWDPYNFRWLSKTFATDDWWWSGVLSSDDKTRLENFGLVVEKPLASGSGQTQNDWAGQIGGIYPDFANYTFKPIALYSDINGTQMNAADISNFYCTSSDNWNNTVVLASINAYSTASASWLCRITKINKTITSNSDFIELLMGFRFPMGNSSPIEKALGSSYVSILSEDDRSTIHRFGLSTFDRDYVYGEIIPDFTKYVFEPIALYSDLSGTQQIEFDMSNIKLTASGEFTLYIHNEGSSVTAMTWKLRITKL